MHKSIVTICLLLVCCIVFSLDITSFETKECLPSDLRKKSIEKSNCRRSDVVFSHSFIVKNIKFVKTPAGDYIQMPLTIRKYDKETKKYSNIKIISPILYNELMNAFGGKNSAQDKPDEIQAEVTSVRSLNSDIRVANVDINFDDQLLVTFGVISKSKFFEVSVPQNFSFRSKKLRNKITNLVLKKADAISKKNDVHK